MPLETLPYIFNYIDIRRLSCMSNVIYEREHCHPGIRNFHVRIVWQQRAVIFLLYFNILFRVHIPFNSVYVSVPSKHIHPHSITKKFTLCWRGHKHWVVNFIGLSPDINAVIITNFHLTFVTKYPIFTMVINSPDFLSLHHKTLFSHSFLWQLEFPLTYEGPFS